MHVYNFKVSFTPSTFGSLSLDIVTHLVFAEASPIIHTIRIILDASLIGKNAVTILLPKIIFDGKFVDINLLLRLLYQHVLVMQGVTKLHPLLPNQ